MANELELARARARARAQQGQAQPKERSLLEAYGESFGNYGSSFNKQLEGLLSVLSSPKQALSTMVDAAAGGMQHLGRALGLDNAGTGVENQQQMDTASALFQDYANAYGGWDEIKNTIATDPLRPTMDFLLPFIPTGATAGATRVGQLATKATPWVERVPVRMMENLLASNIPGKINKGQLRGAAMTKLVDDIPYGEAGRNYVTMRRRESGAALDDALTRAEMSGETIAPLAVYQDILDAPKSRGGGDLDYAVGRNTDAHLQIYTETANDFLARVIDKYGVNSITDGISPKQATKIKRATQAELKKYWDKLARDADVTASHDVSAQVAAWRSLGKNIAGTDHGIRPANTTFHRYALLEGMLESMADKAKKARWVGSDVTMPLFIEMATKGAPGGITAIAATRRYGMDRIQDYLARAMYNRQMGRSSQFQGITPGAKTGALLGFNEAYSNSAQAKEKRREP